MIGVFLYNADTMEKESALRNLEREIAEDNALPLLESNLVFGEGNPAARVLFIGEAPGENEDRERRPFVGRGGQLLRRMIREIGSNEEDVYITNIVKRRPPKNRDPFPEEIAAYSPYLARQIEIINPKIIVTLGRFSMNFFLPDAKITRDQGTVFKTKGRFIVPMFHPAAALRSPQVLGEFEKTFKKLPAIVLKCESLAHAAPSDHGEKKSKVALQEKLF